MARRSFRYRDISEGRSLMPGVGTGQSHEGNRLGGLAVSGATWAIAAVPAVCPWHRTIAPVEFIHCSLPQSSDAVCSVVCARCSGTFSGVSGSFERQDGAALADERPDAVRVVSAHGHSLGVTLGQMNTAKALLRVDCARECDSESSMDRRCYLCSWQADSASTGRVVRVHSAVKNTCMGRSTSLSAQIWSPRAMAMRPIALSLFRQDQSVRAGISNRLLLAVSDWRRTGLTGGGGPRLFARTVGSTRGDRGERANHLSPSTIATSFRAQV